MAVVLGLSAAPFTHSSSATRLEQLQYLLHNNLRRVCCSRYRHPLRQHRLKIMAVSDNDPVREWILGEGGATQINRISPVGGGCISVANRYNTDAGSFFVKTNRDIGPPMFEAEAIGLNTMYATNSVRVPKPFKVGPLPGRGSYIIMEFIEFGSSRSNQAKLGRKLGEMHKSGTSDKGFGFMVDNTIGSTPQQNSWTSDWVTFYGERRLGYQLKLAQQQYRDNDIYEKGQRLLQNLPALFKDIEIKPCLLHGDLWSGNVFSDKDNEPVILDPACYYGHNEAEFGMSWCASFGPMFYNSYFESCRQAKLYFLHQRGAPINKKQGGTKLGGSIQQQALEDVVTVAPGVMEDYETKIQHFFQEHLHAHEEIRFVLDGTGYFDIRDHNEKWIRFRIEKGHLIVLPPGMYHRFTLDTNNYIKVVRMFIGLPCWTQHLRPADEMDARKIYMEKVLKKNTEESINEGMMV